MLRGISRKKFSWRGCVCLGCCLRCVFREFLEGGVCYGLFRVTGNKRFLGVACYRLLVICEKIFGLRLKYLVTMELAFLGRVFVFGG